MIATTAPASPLRTWLALQWRRRTTRTLTAALVVSIAIHALWTLWPVDLASEPEAPVLTATLKEMPAPPPPAVVSEPPPKAKARPRRAPMLTRPAQATPTVTAEAPAPPAAESAPPAAAAPAPQAAPSEAPPPASPPVPPSPEKTLPPRLDLAYKVFLGTQGFHIGDATYRFEHEGDRYRIATVAQARGLAAMIVHGRGKVVSVGSITRDGLQPSTFEIERGSPDKHEVARFDWVNRTVALHDQRYVELDNLTFDPLTVLWQSYFTPPTEDTYSFSVATTRRVVRYTVTREADERIAWSQGEIDTQRWHRKSEDSKVEAWFWLAPSLHYIPVKIRVTQTSRGTLEAMLDAIRTDASPADGPEGSDPPLPPTTHPVDPFADHGQ